MEHHLIP